jgi:hypothetical protein
VAGKLEAGDVAESSELGSGSTQSSKRFRVQESEFSLGFQQKVHLRKFNNDVSKE